MTTVVTPFTPQLIQMFATWGDNGKDELWLHYAWGVLADAGVVPREMNSRAPNYADHVLTLAAVSFIGQRFAEHMGAQGEAVRSKPGTLSGARPRLSRAELFLLAKRAGFVHGSWFHAQELSENLIAYRLSTVLRVLRAELGASVLFSTLWAVTFGPLHDLPLDAQRCHDLCHSQAMASVDLGNWFQ